ncbi:MAG: hypothetical protein CME60_00265 [Halobacteriovoraceae bacterium]|nr:hypothetical protein [Halobacteriovoraceae bacterium]
MTKLALGTVQFGMDYGVSNKTGRVTKNEVKKILATCLDNELMVLDTAYAYGASEEILGEVGVDKFEVISKVPKLDQAEPESIRYYVEKSLSRLELKNIKGMMFHDCNDLLSKKGEIYYSTLKTVCSDHNIPRVGVSVYSPSQLKEVMKNFDVDIVQFPLNLFDQRFLEDGLLNNLKNKGIETYSRSTFLQGLFFLDDSMVPDSIKNVIPDLQKVRGIAAEQEVDISTLALTFVMNSGIDYNVLGVVSNEQLLGNIKDSRCFLNCDFEKFALKDEKVLNPSLW